MTHTVHGLIIVQTRTEACLNTTYIANISYLPVASECIRSWFSSKLKYSRKSLTNSMFLARMYLLSCPSTLTYDFHGPS